MEFVALTFKVVHDLGWNGHLVGGDQLVELLHAHRQGGQILVVVVV